MLLGTTAFGQDLGSSNKLFGGAKTTAPPKNVKKAPASKPKPKSTARKAPVAKSIATPKTRKAPPKTEKAKTAEKTNQPPSHSTAAKSNTTAKSKFTEFKDAKPKTVEIVVGKTKETVISTTAAGENQFEELIESGNSARDDRNYTSAETAYKRAKTIKPRDSRSEYGLGNLYSDQQRWEEAENAYRAALVLDPGNANAHVALSYVLTQPIAVPNLSDRYEEAEVLARKAIQLAPSNALAFDQMGVALELRGLIGAETENAYQKAIKLDPSFAPPYAHLGRLLRRRSLPSESAASYQKAIERSTNVATMVVVAEVMQSEQRYVESEQLLQKALASDPKNTTALLLLGRALTTEGKFADAERILRQSLIVSTNGYMANTLLGSLYARQGRFDEAESALLQALSTVRSREKRLLSQQFEMVGDGYMKTGKARNAERVYRQAIALDADRETLRGKLAKAKQGRP